jgi:hypothetical protein
LYRNQASILFGPPPLDWGEQVVVITGGAFRLFFLSPSGTLTISDIHSSGASGVGELLANTLAVRNVNVVVLDVKPIVSENCVC